jgi:hypothetical protein
MTNKISPLNESKRHPSALLVYLILQEEGRLQPLSREKIASEVERVFGVVMAKKTITDAAGVLKSLSIGEHPLIDFHQRGKLGYQLGNQKSPLSQGELATLLSYFMTLSSEAAGHLMISLRPYLKNEDADMLNHLLSHLPKPQRRSKMTDTLTPYYHNLQTILAAFSQGQEIVCDHEIVSASLEKVEAKKGLPLVPYFLFMKNGRFYLLGGAMGLVKTFEGKKPALYIAAIDHLKNVALSGNAASDLPLGDCLRGKHFDLATYLGSVYFIEEGIFRPASLRGHTLIITSEWAFQLSRSLFGEAVELLDKSVIKPGSKTLAPQVEYRVRLHLDYHAYMMWCLYFVGHYRFGDPRDIDGSSFFSLAYRVKIAKLAQSVVKKA